MDKLKLQPLHLTERPSSGHQGGFGTCAFLPDEGQRALAFGWATTHGKTLDPNRYWLGRWREEMARAGAPPLVVDGE